MKTIVRFIERVWWRMQSMCQKILYRVSPSYRAKCDMARAAVRDAILNNIKTANHVSIAIFD